MGGLKKREMDNEGSESDAPPVRLEREDNEAVPLMMSTGALKDVCCTHRERERKAFSIPSLHGWRGIEFRLFRFRSLIHETLEMSRPQHTHTVHQSSWWMVTPVSLRPSISLVLFPLVFNRRNPWRNTVWCLLCIPIDAIWRASSLLTTRSSLLTSSSIQNFFLFPKPNGWWNQTISTFINNFFVFFVCFFFLAGKKKVVRADLSPDFLRDLRSHTKEGRRKSVGLHQEDQGCVSTFER